MSNAQDGDVLPMVFGKKQLEATIRLGMRSRGFEVLRFVWKTRPNLSLQLEVVQTTPTSDESDGVRIGSSLTVETKTVLTEDEMTKLREAGLNPLDEEDVRRAQEEEALRRGTRTRSPPPPPDPFAEGAAFQSRLEGIARASDAIRRKG